MLHEPNSSAINSTSTQSSLKLNNSIHSTPQSLNISLLPNNSQQCASFDERNNESNNSGEPLTARNGLVDHRPKTRTHPFIHHHPPIHPHLHYQRVNSPGSPKTVTKMTADCSSGTDAESFKPNYNCDILQTVSCTLHEFSRVILMEIYIDFELEKNNDSKHIILKRKK